MGRKDTRTDAQLRDAVTAAGRLARQIGNDTMASPTDRRLRDALHADIDQNLTELESRKRR